MRPLGLLLPPLLAACSAAPSPEAPPPPVPVAPPSASAPASAPAPTPPPEEKRTFAVDSRATPQDIDHAMGDAPCDFDRAYRGSIGPTKVSLKLRRLQTGALEGQSHYDRPGKAIALRGSASAERFKVAEANGGTFEGMCVAGGLLRGTFTMGKSKTPFEFRPWPAGMPAMYALTRETTGEPSHPLCAKNAAKDRIVTVQEEENGQPIICLPTDPKKRRELVKAEPSLLCSASDIGYRVFGSSDPTIEQKINDTLASTGYEPAAREAQRCSGVHQHIASMGLIAWVDDVLSVSLFRSEYTGGAHPMNSGLGSMLIDLRTGSLVRLDEVVEQKGLRDLASACLPYFAASRADKSTFSLSSTTPIGCGQEALDARYLWACDKDDIAGPIWSVVPGGLVIGSWANAHVNAANDGKGPILSWASLARAGLLRSSSPVARLWKGATDRDAPLPCSSAYEGERIISWRETTVTR